MRLQNVVSQNNGNVFAFNGCHMNVLLGFFPPFVLFETFLQELGVVQHEVRQTDHGGPASASKADDDHTALSHRKHSHNSATLFNEIVEQNYVDALLGVISLFKQHFLKITVNLLHIRYFSV